MADDEPDNERQPAPIQKRKADDSLAARKAPKLPRLDPLASLSARPISSSNSGSAPGPSRTQAPPSTAPARPRPTHARASSETSSSEFPGTISQTVQRTNQREKEREEARQRARQRPLGNPYRHELSTARKHTSQPKNIRKVTTSSLLQNAQRSSDSSSSSAARTRIRKRNYSRLNHGDVMGRSRPLESARERATDVIELSDSTDSARARPSQSTNARPRPSLAANKDDPIVISSGSDDDSFIASLSRRNRNRPPSSTQARNQPRTANHTRAPPPAGAEVISLTDSDGDTAPRSVAPASQSVSARPRPNASLAPRPTSGVNGIIPPPQPSQQASNTPPTIAAAASASTSAPAPTSITASEPAPASMSTSRPSEQPSTIPQDNPQPNTSATPPASPQPSYEPPPDDLDFSNFDTADDGIQNDNEWRDVDLGASFSAPPVGSSTGPVSAGVRESTEDSGAQDSLFDSYINMDELEQGGDQEMSEVAKTIEPPSDVGVGAGAVEKVVEKEDVPKPKPSTPEEGEISENSQQSQKIAKDNDVVMNLEEGEVDPNDMPPQSSSPESGEITNGALGKQPQEKSNVPTSMMPPSPPVSQPQPVPVKLASTSTVLNVSQPSPTSTASASLSPTATKPPSSTFPSLARTSTLVMPDISSYKSVRFKRSLPEARENSFFSRALAGVRSTRNVSGGVEDGGEKVEKSTSKVVSPLAQVSSSVKAGAVEKQGDGDTEMRDVVSRKQSITTVPAGDADVDVPIPSRSPSAVREEQSTLTGVQVEASTIAEPSINAEEGLPKSAVETQTSVETISKPSQIPVEAQQVPSMSEGEVPPADRAPSASMPVQPQTPQKLAEKEPEKEQDQIPPTSEGPVQTATRPVIAPPRIPRPHTPLSLVDALNEVFRERQQLDLMTRKRSLVNLTDERAGSSSPKTTVEGQQVAPVSGSSRTDSEGRSRSPSRSATPGRPVGKVPSLDNLRSLLAKRNLSASQLSRASPAEANASAGSSTSAVSDPMVTSKGTAGPVAGAIDTSDTRSTGASTSGHPSTPAPASSSSGVGPRKSDGVSAKKRHPPLVPFEAFISPIQPRKVPSISAKGEEKEKEPEITHADPFTSPTIPRSRASLGTPLLGSTQRKMYSPERARRQSTSAAFEACIVRESPVQERFGRALPRPPRPNPMRFREAEVDGSVSVSSSEGSSPSVPEMVPQACVGVDGGEGVSGVRDTAVDDAMQVGERPGEVGGDSSASNNVEDGSGGAEDEGDETDQLLELASVHLSQEEEVVPEMGGEQTDVGGGDGGDGDVAMDVDEKIGGISEEVVVPAAVAVHEPEQPPQSPQGVGTSGVDEVNTTQETSTDAGPSLPVTAEEIASTSQPSFDVTHDSNKEIVAESSRESTTPELILPEGDNSAEADAAELAPPIASTSEKEVPRVTPRQVHKRRRSGEDGDSADECAAILTSADNAGSETESDAVPPTSSASSKTASSTSLRLPPPRTRSRRSKQRSVSSEASSIDPLDTLKKANRTRASPAEKPQAESNEEYIGGYRVITWKSLAAQQRNCEPEYKRSKDLPHELQDHMNALPADFRNSDFGRKIFEAHIRQATADELEAPPIEIYDNGLGDEMTPKWEFHYTNEMWHGEGVGPPDIKNLESCGCIGKCDPKSKSCECGKKQMKWLQWYIDNGYLHPNWPGSPFVYDHKGVLQTTDFPIFECNRFCHCDEDCPNRVVQNGRKWPVHIAKTEHKGWGVFAGAKKIPKGSYLGIYAGELLTEQEGDARGSYYDIYGRTYLFSIDFHHLKLKMDDPDEWENLYVVDAYHAGNFTRFLNHSCDPNCKIFACYIDEADINKPLMAVFTTRDVDPWEELCFSYYGDIDEKREEIKNSRVEGQELVKDHAVYARCRCEADNCIGRLFS